MIKRLIDIFVAFFVMIFLLPVMLCAAIAVRLSSPGPVIFRQFRVGRNGHLFEILKFRTMQNREGVGRGITVGHDVRVTRVGQFLRKWKIDEIPQLINVLRGEMSLVGPRPDLPSYVGKYPEDQKRIIQRVRPGITDWASIKYRNENEILGEQADPDRYYDEVILPDKLALGVNYAQNYSIFEDCQIIYSTILSIVRD